MTNFSIIAYHYTNQETLLRFIDSIKFVEDIVIIDGTNSIDKSIFQNNSTLIIINIDATDLFKVELTAKNKIKNDWYLSLNTNYILNQEIINEINTLDLSNPQNEYLAKREFEFLGTTIKYGSIENSCISILKHKNDEIKNKIKLKNKILNKPLESIDLYNNSISSRMKSESNELIINKNNTNFIKLLFYPFAFLMYHYFIRGGFLNGKKGFILVYFHTFGLIKKYLFVWLHNNNLN